MEVVGTPQTLHVVIEVVSTFCDLVWWRHKNLVYTALTAFTPFHLSHPSQLPSYPLASALLSLTPVLTLLVPLVHLHPLHPCTLHPHTLLPLTPALSTYPHTLNALMYHTRAQGCKDTRGVRAGTRSVRV